jgi:hypothetical protein
VSARSSSRAVATIKTQCPSPECLPAEKVQVVYQQPLDAFIIRRLPAKAGRWKGEMCEEDTTCPASFECLGKRDDARCPAQEQSREDRAVWSSRGVHAVSLMAGRSTLSSMRGTVKLKWRSIPVLGQGRCHNIVNHHDCICQLHPPDANSLRM